MFFFFFHLTFLVVMIEHYGFIPNGARAYYLNRSQPVRPSLPLGLWDVPQLVSLPSAYPFCWFFFYLACDSSRVLAFVIRNGFRLLYSNLRC